jgi:hypothetical protein
MTSSVLVTGASSGIGYSIAKMLVENRFHVFASVRRSADAERLKREFGDALTPLIFDVIDADAIQAAATQVAAQLNGARLAGLVNNAGVAVAGPMDLVAMADLRRQFEINVFAPVALVQAFAPLLGSDPQRNGPPGRIINMSSVSGKLVAPFLGPYASSKHALEAVSDAMRRELAIYGVKVVIIEPGVIKTPIWDKAEQTDLRAFQNSDYRAAVERLLKRAVTDGREKGAPPELVARAVLRALTAPNPPARVAIVSNYVTGWLIPRLLPARLLDKIVARMTGLKHSDHKESFGR